MGWCPSPLTIGLSGPALVSGRAAPLSRGNMLLDNDSFARRMNQLAQMREITVDTETTGLIPQRDHMVGASVRGEDGECHYLPFRHLEANLDPGKLDMFIQLIQTKRMIFFNAPFDLQFLWKEGMKRIVDLIDVLPVVHVVNENRYQYGLKPLAVSIFGRGADSADIRLQHELDSALLAHKGEMYKLHPSRVQEYACDDVDLTYRIWQHCVPTLEEEGTMGIALGCSQYALVIGHMQWKGVPIDEEAIRESMAEARAHQLHLHVRACKMAGRRVNLDSPKDMSKWIGLPSTAEDKIGHLVESDERVATLMEYRSWAAACSRYYKPFLDRNIDSNIHCSFKQHGTISGRLACSEPNMQALPRDTSTFGVKGAIVAPPGFMWIQADYSQAEIRMACHYGPEHAMAALVKSGKHMHRTVAEELKIPVDAAKRLNFSVIYGIGGKTLAHNLRTTEAHAERYLSKYHEKYPGFKRLYKRAEDAAIRRRYIKMWTGRRRHFFPNNRVPAGFKHTPFHKASSNLIQGGVAELLRVKQTLLYYELGLDQRLQVHDSAVMLCPSEDVHTAVPCIKEIMEDHDTFSIPMTVDISYGPNLRDMKNWGD